MYSTTRNSLVACRSIEHGRSPRVSAERSPTRTIDTEGPTNARQLAFGTSAGYSFHQGGLDFGPDVALDYTPLAVNGYTENDANLSGMAQVSAHYVHEFKN